MDVRQMRRLAGAVTITALAGKTNDYADTALRSAGTKQGGILDFYEVHYFSANGASNSVFTHPASYWSLDKKIVVGEFVATATDSVALKDLSENLYDNGYYGGWLWSYTDVDTDGDSWPAPQTPLETVSTMHPDVGTCPLK